MDTITSLSNPLIKQIRAIRQKKARIDSGTFLVEGIHHIGEALQAAWDIRSIVYAPDVLTSAYAHDLLKQAERIGTQLQPVSEKVIESLADKENPQGILAVINQRNADFRDLKPIQSAVALVSPNDPGNVGTILRTMDAVNADAIFLLDGGVELYHPTVVRASMGALFWKPAVQATFGEFISWARVNKYQLIGTSARAQVDYRALVPQTPWILLLGNEQKGLSNELIDACDVTVSLPMGGRASSLNLAVAAGVLLYQFRSSNNFAAKLGM